MLLGIGDDAAELSFRSSAVISTDTLVCGTHYTADADPYFLGRKSLAVALSDLAAMGSRPRHALLSLTLERVDDDWLGPFATGFFSVADEHDVALVGGDLCRGSVSSVTVTVLGESVAKLLRQSGAKVDDAVWLSGEIGAAGDELRSNAPASPGSALHDPSPRIALGTALVGAASGAIDLSDGLCAGALALADGSGCRIELDGERIPVVGAGTQAVTKERLVEAICSGEDYELLFTAPASMSDVVEACGKETGVPLARVGLVLRGSGSVVSVGGDVLDLQELEAGTYQHFSVSQGNVPGEGDRDRRLVEEIAMAALRKQSRVFVAESCTGGLLAGSLTSVAGSSDWFEGGAATYSVRMKQRVLGVDLGTVKKHGVVSEQVAKEMCAGSLAFDGVTHSVAITGWAGPDGGDGQPAGTVCIAWLSDESSEGMTYSFSGDRDSVRRQAVSAALAGLKRSLENGK